MRQESNPRLPDQGISTQSTQLTNKNKPYFIINENNFLSPGYVIIKIISKLIVFSIFMLSAYLIFTVIIT